VPARAAIRPGPVRGAAGDATGARARGRLAFAVFSEIPAYYAALAEALARPVSGDAAASCLSRYTLREATTGRQLVEDAGFGAIEMHLPEVMRRMPASPASVVEAMARALTAVTSLPWRTPCVRRLDGRSVLPSRPIVTVMRS
jgi:hypothetical protein